MVLYSLCKPDNIKNDDFKACLFNGSNFPSIDLDINRFIHLSVSFSFGLWFILQTANHVDIWRLHRPTVVADLALYESPKYIRFIVKFHWFDQVSLKKFEANRTRGSRLLSYYRSCHKYIYSNLNVQNQTKFLCWIFLEKFLFAKIKLNWLYMQSFTFPFISK